VIETLVKVMPVLGVIDLLFLLMFLVSRKPIIVPFLTLSVELTILPVFLSSGYFTYMLSAELVNSFSLMGLCVAAIMLVVTGMLFFLLIYWTTITLASFTITLSKTAKEGEIK